MEIFFAAKIVHILFKSVNMWRATVDVLSKINCQLLGHFLHISMSHIFARRQGQLCKIVYIFTIVTVACQRVNESLRVIVVRSGDGQIAALLNVVKVTHAFIRLHQLVIIQHTMLLSSPQAIR